MPPQRFIQVFLFLFLGNITVAQSYKINWCQPSVISFSGEKNMAVLCFEGAVYETENHYLPLYKLSIPDPATDVKIYEAKLTNTIFQPLSEEEINILKENAVQISSSIDIHTSSITIKKKKYTLFSFLPIRQNILNGVYEKLISFDITYDYIPDKENKKDKIVSRTSSSSSVLRYGNWYKIAIAENGIYKLSYSFLDSLGIDMNNLIPKSIRLYGNGGGMLSEVTSDPRSDDLIENAIFVSGENDGKFDKDDYVLFYGEAQNIWKYKDTTSSCPKYRHALNLYTDSSYYFLVTNIGPGKRIQTQASSSLSPTHTVTRFDDYVFHEKEAENFYKSGKQWFGEYFENNSSGDFSFNFPNIDNSSPVRVKVQIASRCITSAGAYTFSSQSAGTTLSLPAVSNDVYTSDYAEIGNSCFLFNPLSDQVKINVTKQTPAAIAWLDYIEINARRLLTMNGDQMAFRDIQSVGGGNVAQFNVVSNDAIKVWDVSDIHNVKNQLLNKSGNNYLYTLSSDTLKQFVAFNGKSFKTPIINGKVVNQNLHDMSNVDFVIVTHSDFYSEALQLATYHKDHDGLTFAVVTPQQIYNEFSSGARDVSAIRDFVKMLYDKAATPDELPQYLLLFGDGSYDNKDRLSNNINYIPTYQSQNSTFLTSSYVSDDFFGLLDDGEGLWISDAVDIGVGRMPVKSKQEAATVVQKIMNYTKKGIASTENATHSDSPFGNWRNNVCFIADDGDSDVHISQADQQATFLDTTYKNYTIDKIYIDAYKQETLPGGNRYPDVNTAINNRIERGALIINWTGHGGVWSMAHEEIANTASVQTWSNASKLFFFITATCEMSRYDDPENNSLGELAFLNSNGGAIALFTTVRRVYAAPNFLLNRDIYKCAFEPINGRMPRLGDIYQFVKTQPGGNSVNSRNFTLMGDPALTLAYPKQYVVTDSINFKAVDSTSSDTLRALSYVTVSGHLTDEGGVVLNNYNGVIYSTIYDKSDTITTLSNKGSVQSPPYTFVLQKNILFNGKTSVKNGYFKFAFIVPKDIKYNYGLGRISYYAENGSEDAAGYYERVVIGGYDSTAPPDNKGPEIDLYMNNDKFVFGGMTDENPGLYAVLFDENGINIVGNAIGHDITAIMDGNIQKPLVLNEFYKADLNTYQRGTIQYPYKDLAEGKHTLKIKAWDVYNNSSESYTEFVVARSSYAALSHVLNYPNPFTTKTQFFFEHNQPNNQFEVQIQIFTIAGKLVKTINSIVYYDGYRSEPIEWDGKDDFGDKIGRGVYIYKIKIKTDDNGVAEKYEKLVILN